MDLGNLSRPTKAGWVPRSLEWLVGGTACVPKHRGTGDKLYQRDTVESGQQSSEDLRREEEDKSVGEIRETDGRGMPRSRCLCFWSFGVGRLRSGVTTVITWLHSILQEPCLALPLACSSFPV